MFEPALVEQCVRLIDLCRSRNILLATAESCTGGLIAGLITSVPGSSDVFDRGFVTYSNEATRAKIVARRRGARSGSAAMAETIRKPLAL
jgi:nicotinamide-nucleotide amidase